jgi:hypothetical protein
MAKKAQFDFILALKRWGIGAAVGLLGAIYEHLVGGGLISTVPWDEVLSAVVKTTIAAAIIDLGAWKNFPAPTDETE